MAWRQIENCACVAGEAPDIFANEYIGKFFNDNDGHAEANFLPGLRANEWVFDAGYQQIVGTLNNLPCRHCCVLFRLFMEEILLRFPSTRR